VFIKALGLQDNSSLIHSIHVIMNDILNDVHKTYEFYDILTLGYRLAIYLKIQDSIRTERADPKSVCIHATPCNKP